MPIGSILAVFFVVWWLCFVAVLPIGTQSQHEIGNVTPGTEPGAPAVPRLLRKVIVATLLAAVVTPLLLWGVNNGILHDYWNR
ncbi:MULTISPECIES: DUF1467 family protein [unclassified Devosia]|uniref:DUF1467 family protein n=1 Tax=unclassified Devosia TaxID=196773 RepID=UPI0015516517|nr:MULTISPECIES: DUF1467 family protein [unclassified Devosia]